MDLVREHLDHRARMVAIGRAHLGTNGAPKCTLVLLVALSSGRSGGVLGESGPNQSDQQRTRLLHQGSLGPHLAEVHNGPEKRAAREDGPAACSLLPSRGVVTSANKPATRSATTHSSVLMRGTYGVDECGERMEGGRDLRQADRPDASRQLRGHRVGSARG